jgi:hypothetical protein
MNKHAPAMYVCMEAHPTVACLRCMFEAVNFVEGDFTWSLRHLLSSSQCARCCHMAATELKVLKYSKGWLPKKFIAQKIRSCCQNRCCWRF